ncbi:class I SAM-dependent methyltransferase [Bacteroidota bacterium]
MSKFYSTIADNYDYIFPLNKNQVEFIIEETNKPYNNKHVLEVGCGTGSLPFGLSDYKLNITGIDFDSEMIQKAKEKCNSKSNISIDFLDMRKLTEAFQPNSFDTVICFGNTLVHLTNPEDICSFINQASKILAKNGILLMQIINYDRILDKHIEGLPTIENDKIKFQRLYDLDSLTGLIRFSTILTIKSLNKTINNDVMLYPLRKDELNAYLMKAGFKEIFYYRDFKKSAYENNSIPLVLSARL